MLQNQRHWRYLTHSIRGWGMLSAVDDVGLWNSRMTPLCGFMYSVPSEYRKFFSFPFSKSNVCTCPVDPLRRPDSVSSDTIPCPALTSVRILFRHIAGEPSKSLLVHADREPWDRACDSDSGGAHLNYRVNTDIGLFLFHERTFFVVYRIVVCTIIQ